MAQASASVAATGFFGGTGFWVSIVGAGGSIIASACTVFTEFDAQLTVYVGTCDALECVEGIDNVPETEFFRLDSGMLRSGEVK